MHTKYVRHEQALTMFGWNPLFLLKLEWDETINKDKI